MKVYLVYENQTVHDVEFNSLMGIYKTKKLAEEVCDYWNIHCTDGYEYFVDEDEVQS